VNETTNNKPKFLDYLNIYEFETVLPGSGETVKFKPLTTGQLKKLLIYENETNIMVQEDALDELIGSCVISENFDIDNLYLQDRFFLLMEIRKKTKGEKFDFTYKCPKCESQILNSINLDDLKVTKIPEDIDNSLALTDHIGISLRHIKRKDFKTISKYIDIKDKTELQINSEIQTALFAAGIEAIATQDGVEEDISLVNKMYLVDNVPTSAFELIKKWYEDNDFGLDMVISASCSNCGHKEITDVPMGNFFL